VVGILEPLDALRALVAPPTDTQSH
jgi:hypothetical protein